MPSFNDNKSSVFLWAFFFRLFASHTIQYHTYDDTFFCTQFAFVRSVRVLYLIGTGICIFSLCTRIFFSPSHSTFRLNKRTIRSSGTATMRPFFFPFLKTTYMQCWRTIILFIVCLTKRNVRLLAPVRCSDRKINVNRYGKTNVSALKAAPGKTFPCSDV